jgi:CubicO group peptidase (beta-lactamase class C family)
LRKNLSIFLCFSPYVLITKIQIKSKMERRHFIKVSGMGASLVAINPYSLLSDIPVPKAKLSLPRATPSSMGVDPQAIINFIKAANASEQRFHSFMLVRHGNVVAEGWWSPFDKDKIHTLYSLSKSFTSTAIGMLVKDGKLSVEDQVIKLFPEHVPAAISENLRSMKLKHMLSMNTGHDKDTTDGMRNGKVEWEKSFLAQEITHAPGSHFLYNSGATYMCSSLVKKITGLDTEQFLQTRLFDKLGIVGQDWEKNNQGISVGGWGLRVKTEDIAKFGQLYLQKGMWNGEQLLTPQWVNEATSKITTSNPGDGQWSQGYGYQFWRCKNNMYRGDGAFGQYCIVMPDQDAVLAVTSESWDMGKGMEIIFDNLIQGLKANPLSENVVKSIELKNLCASLTLSTVKGTNVAQKTKLNILCEPNDFGISSIKVSTDKKGSKVTFMSDKGVGKTIQAGHEKWIVNKDYTKYLFTSGNRNQMPTRIAASSSWQGTKVLQINNRFVDAIHGDRITIDFNDKNKVSIALLSSPAENTKTNPDNRKPIMGKLI